VLLPLVLSVKRSAPQERGAAAAVLWAEDNGDDRALIQEALQGWASPRVTFVDDGTKALQRLREGTAPDLVVLDLRMPVMGGLETLRRIRAAPGTAGIPVAVFTGGNIPQEIDELRELGVTAVRQKPIQFPDFIEAVKGVLGGG
jgi:two-component system chemotaxis response regulator CheY